MTTPVVLVTGGAGGIGQETVHILLEELEACVIATDIVEGSLNKLQETYPGRLEIIIGDITDVRSQPRPMSR
jgi:NAD(P)-dependent dehydrogenase (short-subunit alcohol dehydrogenase family)